jgi:pimeloyl-ACP methyl ester carboxylesterase
MPVTLVTGAYDRTYTELAGQMAAVIGDGAQTVLIPGAGHALHLERPDALAAVLRGA